ncbi:MAG: MBL fold metallo-hydrolase [Pseudomonadales bacterium]|nr:MBL fold metallo-hydrolase [Pseudomonadales bacterium]
MHSARHFTLLFAALFALAPFAAAQNFDAVEITATPLGGNVHLLQGQGGNMAVSIGGDGALLVDDQFGPLADKTKAKIAELGGGAPAFILNTHWHGDHTGGNEFFADAGTIIAHDNVRLRLADAARLPDALPVITYAEGISVHYNGEEIRLIHLPAGHTDGDSAVWFTGSKVIHLGDEFVNNGFPFIDIQSGGTLVGFLANARRVLELVPDDILLIPGHGTVSSKAQFGQWLADLTESVNLVQVKMSEGKDLPSIIAEGLPEKYASWGQGFINESAWITTIYNSASASPR